MFMILKTDHYQLWFLYKSDFHIFTAEKLAGKIRIKHKTRKYLLHCLSDEGLPGSRRTFSNKCPDGSLHGGPLEITLTVPLTTNSLGEIYSLILEYSNQPSLNLSSWLLLALKGE